MPSELTETVEEVAEVQAETLVEAIAELPQFKLTELAASRR